jgi:sugar phosphate isomerase/epimerase
MAAISVSEVTTYLWPFDKDVQTYASYGLSSIGVWRQKLTDYGEEKGAELLAEVGMDVSHLYFAGGFTGYDGGSLQDAIDDAQQALEVAALIQADCLTLYTGSRGGHTYNHAHRLLQLALDQILPTAEELGVALALEPMDARAAADWTFLTDLEQALEVVDRRSHPLLKMALDTYHWGGDEKLYSLLPDLVPHLAIVHLGDCTFTPSRDHERCLLGAGNVPLQSMITALSEHGYDATYDIRLMGEDIEVADDERVLRDSYQFVEQMLRSCYSV